MRKKEIKIIAFAVLACMICSSTFATTTTPAGQTSPNGTPTSTVAPTPTPTPTPMPTSTGAPASTQVPQTNSGNYSNGKKSQPFVLDNFKVIEMTLSHFGVDSTKLADYIRQGKKLEDVLKAERISVRRFKRKIIEEYYKAVEEGVANNQLTEEQADKLKSAIKETVKGWLPRK
jgi:hypothetical protein